VIQVVRGYLIIDNINPIASNGEVIQICVFFTHRRISTIGVCNGMTGAWVENVFDIGFVKIGVSDGGGGLWELFEAAVAGLSSRRISTFFAMGVSDGEEDLHLSEIDESARLEGQVRFSSEWESLLDLRPLLRER